MNSANAMNAMRVTLAVPFEGDEPVIVDPEDGTLRRIDATRAELSRPGTSPVAVLLGPAAAPSADGRRRGEVVVEGWRFELDVEPERRAALRERAARDPAMIGHGGAVEVRAIIPGRVVAIAVTAGDAVEAGRQLLVIEAMKMQNELRAPRAGIVERVSVAEGQTVDLGDLLVTLR